MNGISIDFNMVLINTEDTFKVFDFFSAISYCILGNFSNNIFFAFFAITFISHNIQYADIISGIRSYKNFSNRKKND